jgi:16S rRNA G966 N2-methylase RsmD
MTAAAPERRRVRYNCTRCGAATDAFTGTDRELNGACRDCVTKREDRRPRELNDLSGAEWAQASKSVQEYPDTRSEKQRLHGAAFPMSLAKQQISVYTRAGQTVLDPFVGVGTTLDACAQIGRNGIGIELSDTYRELAAADLKPGDGQTLIGGDAMHLDQLIKPDSVDMVLTSPPYAHLLKQVKGAFAYKWQEHSKIAPVRNPLPYSDSPRDLGNLPYAEYLTAITTVFEKTRVVMRDGAYAVWVVKDFRATKEKIPFVPFHMHVADCAAAAGLKFWDLQVYDQTRFRPLVCLGYPSRNYYMNIGHSYLLVFRK